MAEKTPEGTFYCCDHCFDENGELTHDMFEQDSHLVPCDEGCDEF
jgi:hypothetical protein